MIETAEDIQDPPETDTPAPTTPPAPVPPAPKGDPDNVKVLYDAASKDYDVGDYETFKKSIQDPENRKTLYETVGKKYDLGTYEEFEKELAPPVAADTRLSDLRSLKQVAGNDPLISVPGGQVKQSAGDPVFAATKQKAQADYASKITDLSTDLGVAPSDVLKTVNDFPENNDVNHLKDLVQMRQTNPAGYQRYVAADQNKNMIAKTSVHAANMYNELQGDADHPIYNMDQLTSAIDQQKNIINSTLSGEDNAKAMANLEINRAPSFNALNPEITSEMAMKNGSLGDLDANQFAGLASLQQFDPQRYQVYSRILKDVKGKTDLDHYEKLGLEKIQKELLDKGRSNTQNWLSEQQHVLSDKYQVAQSDEERQAIKHEFDSNVNMMQQNDLESQNEYAKFPGLKDQEFERQTRDLMGAGEEGVIGRTLHTFGATATSGLDAIGDAVNEMFGSSEDVSRHRMSAIGESSEQSARQYQPTIAKTDEPAKFQFDATLQKQADKIKSDPSLSNDDKYTKLYSLVRDNPDKVHTVTNPDFGKSANFFSMSTALKSASTIGYVAGVAAQTWGLKGLGASKIFSEMAPMYLTASHDLYKEAIAKGNPNPLQYVAVNSTILALAGAVNPDLGIVKRSIGMKPELESVLNGISEQQWKDVIRAHAPLVTKIRNSLTSTAKETVKMGLTYGAGTAIAKDIANRGIFNEKISDEEILQHGLQGLRDITTSGLPLMGLHFITNLKDASPHDQARIWDLGSNVKLSSEKIDHDVKSGLISSDVGEQRKQVVKNVGRLIESVPTEDVKGKPLTDQQKVGWLYRTVMKEKIGKLKGDLPEHLTDKLDGISKGIDIQNGAIIDPTSVRRSVETGLANTKIPDMSPLKHYEGNGPELLKFIQEHVTGKNSDGSIGDIGPASLPEGMFPEHLVEHAVRLLPDEEKRNILETYDSKDIKVPEKIRDWLHTEKIEEPSKSAPAVVMPKENTQPNVVPLKVAEPEEDVNTRTSQSTLSDEAPLPKGETIVTPSGMTEPERQRAIEDRQKKTGNTDTQNWENDLNDKINKTKSGTASSKKDANDKVRQEVRKKNAELGYEKYRYDNNILRKNTAIRKGTMTGPPRWRKVSSSFKDAGNQSIHEQGVVLRDRPVELQKNFDELSNVAEHLEVPDASNNAIMSKEQVEKAVEDVNDGIPSVGAHSLLDVLEDGLKKDQFPKRDTGGKALTFAELTGGEKQVTGEPLDEKNITSWLDDESKLTPEHEEVLRDNLENLIDDYTNESPAKSEVPVADAGTEKTGSEKTEPGTGAETKKEPVEKTGGPKLTIETPEVKEAPPKEPPPAKAETPKAEQPAGVRISKQGVFDQYGERFKKTRIGWNEITKDAVSELSDDATKNGTTVAQEAENQVNKMVSQMMTSKRKLAVSEHNIATAAIHLMNLDERIDEVKSLVPEDDNYKLSQSAELFDLMNKRHMTLELIDLMGSKSGRNLGIYAGIFSKNDDGGIGVHRDIISQMLGHEMPKNLADLEASKTLSLKEKDLLRPYVEKLEKIQADYDAVMKETEKKSSPKSAEAQRTKSQKAATKLRDWATKWRENKGTLEDIIGKPIEGVHKQGFSVDVHEAIAKALEYIADKIEKGFDISEAIKGAADEHHGKSDRDDFEGLLNRVLKQDKEMSDITEGPFDVKSDAREQEIEWQRRKTLGELKALAQSVQDNASPLWRTAIDYRRSFLIGGMKTLVRVAEAGASKMITDPLINMTAGNLISKLVPGMSKGSTSIETMAEGYKGLFKFKNDEEAMHFVKEKLDAFDAASKELKADMTNPEKKTAYMKAELESASAGIYAFIHGHIGLDALEQFKSGSTAFEQAMGGYAKVDPALLRGAHKALYILNSITRLHAIEKNPSARRALVESYNNTLLKMQEDGKPLSTSNRMLALDTAYGEFLAGKFQNKTWASRFVNNPKYAGYKKDASWEDKALSIGLNVALPVAKIAINIVKTGLDASTGGVEGWATYAYAVRKSMKQMSPEQLSEYKTVWEKINAAAQAIPEEKRMYMRKVMARGLFGIGMMGLGAYGAVTGNIRYGGEYDPDHEAKRKQFVNGKWEDDLDYGQWEIMGHKFSKFQSSVINHLPEFLPLAMIVNGYHVYKYEKNYKGSTGDRETKSTWDALWEAGVRSNMNEVYERLPFNNLLHPIKMLEHGILSVPIAKETMSLFDKDADKRKPHGVMQHLADGIGAYGLVDKKEKK